MEPSQVSAELRRIAAGIECCGRPVRPNLVSRDLRRVLAAVAQTGSVRLDSVEYVPPAPDDELGMPSFKIRGTIKKDEGDAFDGILSIEIDGREIHYEPASGVDPTGPDYYEGSNDLYSLVGQSPAWQKAEAQEGY